MEAARSLWRSDYAVSYTHLDVYKRQDVYNVRPTYTRWIVNSRIGESGNFAKLIRSRLRQFLHFRLCPEMQAPCWARLNASRLQPHRHAVVAQRAFENFARRRAELRNIERAARHAIAATDAVRFLEIHNPVGVLDDGCFRRTSRQAARIFACLLYTSRCV